MFTQLQKDVMAELRKNRPKQDLRQSMSGTLLLDRYYVKQCHFKKKNSYVVQDENDEQRMLELLMIDDFEMLLHQVKVMRAIEALYDRQAQDSKVKGPQHCQKLIETYGIIEMDDGKNCVLKEDPVTGLPILDKREFDDGKIETKFFIIMPSAGKHLSKFLKENSCLIRNICVFKIGVQLLDLLEAVHNAGFVYNNLKLDNICLDLCQ